MLSERSFLRFAQGKRDARNGNSIVVSRASQVRTLTSPAVLRGFALVAVLLLVAVVSLVTATVLQTTSTEIQISGNHKQAVQEFYAAEAGLAEARSRLRKTMGAEAYFIRDTGMLPDLLWTAYIVASAEWSPSVDPEYSPHTTNVIPVPGNPTNTVVQPNSVQTDLPYWVKIRHKTEYDAKQAGHKPATPHYVDRDGSDSLALARATGATSSTSDTPRSRVPFRSPLRQIRPHRGYLSRRSSLVGLRRAAP